MKNNKIQFAVAREDPNIEADLILKFKMQNVLLIGSGGCTAFHLKTLYPDLNVSILDPNPAQLNLIQQKLSKLNNNDFDLNILNTCGNFESLFTQWRLFVHEFIADPGDIHNILFHNAPIDDLLTSPYWETSFELFFSNALLVTMFGPSAIQHAEPGSYPKYFQRVFENGLKRQDRSTNYYLHHIFLGNYHPDYMPLYLSKKTNKKIVLNHVYHSNAQDIHDLNEYDLISFSNIFDWMSDADSKEILSKLSQNMKVGSCFILRQLNNNRYYDLGPNFDMHTINLEDDRSLFYNKITVYQRKV